MDQRTVLQGNVEDRVRTFAKLDLHWLQHMKIRDAEISVFRKPSVEIFVLETKEGNRPAVGYFAASMRNVYSTYNCWNVVSPTLQMAKTLQCLFIKQSRKLSCNCQANEVNTLYSLMLLSPLLCSVCWCVRSCFISHLSYQHTLFKCLVDLLTV